MPTTKYDPNPAPAVPPEPWSLTDQVLTYAWDKDKKAVPVKLLKITNLHDETIYPVLRDANEAEVPGFPLIGLYDPHDPVGKEYRGYIGYKIKDGKDDKYFFGLKPKKSIIIRVPLVYWNGARMGITTDGQYLAPTGTTKNPMQFSPSANMIIAPDEKDPNDKDPSLINNGVVLWYTAAKNAPALDSPDQLVEWTIRDKEYLSSPEMKARTHDQIPAGERVTLINYDVSYVDNMFFPVAMEALDVPIPAAPFPPGRKKQPYGWVGAIRDSKKLQNKIEEFTSDNNDFLGKDYFGGKGWPKYNIPMSDIKIPAAQNVFAQSPLSDTRSSYATEAYMLSSGGTLKDLISVSIGVSGTFTGTSGYFVTLDATYPPELYAFIKQGYQVEGHIDNKPNPIAPGTLVDSYDPATHTVKLTKELQAGATTASLQFTRPPVDYASTALINLWFSWANHYLNLPATKQAVEKSIVGSVAFESPTLTFTGSQSGLIQGMQVTGPGLPDPDPSKFRGGVIILEIAEDGRSVLLSQIASASHPIGEGKVYTFKPPQPITPTPAGTYTFNFSSDTPDPSREPAEFSKKVFLVMASMNQIPKGPNPKAPYLNELMNNVVGGNMGFIFENGAKANVPGAIISTVVIRDTLKSILRGVTDFTLHPERKPNGDLDWYPDPKIGKGGKKFNVFNLDPFVRFVHVDLGFSGYGFSLDDDTADVGAGQATRLLITVGGRPPGDPGPVNGIIRAKTNPNEWTIQAPYGTVRGKGTWDPSLTKSVFLNIMGASNTTPIMISSPGHGLRNGEKITLSEVGGNTNANGDWKITNVTKDTFELVGSQGNANWTSGGKWTTGPMPYITLDKDDIDDVYWRILADDRTAGFQGAFVTTEGLLNDTDLVRVSQRGDTQQGILLLSGTLTLSRSDKPLRKGKYTWTFSGTRPEESKLNRLNRQ
jgi:hypothetical protein